MGARWLCAAVLLAACGDEASCPDGLVAREGRCVPEACGDCTPPRAVCDVANAVCVECLRDEDCAGAPGTCEANRCACRPGAFCDDPATPICAAGGSCVACRGDESCGPFGWCDGAGRCVECTPQRPDCAEFACDPVALECGDVPRGTVARCAPCRADAECAEGLACVETRFEGAPVGYRCVPRAEGGCPSGFDAVEGASRDGTVGRHCLPFDEAFTCAAYLDAVRGEPCAVAEDCGADGLMDGYCPNGVCTIPCREGDGPCLGDGVCPPDGLCFKAPD